MKTEDYCKVVKALPASSIIKFDLAYNKLRRNNELGSSISIDMLGNIFGRQ